MEFGPVHEALKPLEWLIGTWKSTKAHGSFPSIQPFTYCEEISFVSIGQPMLNFSSSSWNPIKKNPMHFENGFLRIKPGSTQVAFIVAHNFGLTTLEEGNVSEHLLEVESTQISRMSFANKPQVVGIERVYKLINDTELEYTLRMETFTIPMTDHLKVVYKKV